MPKLYDYFGIVVMFYSNEHDPVHVHGKYQGHETRAEIIVVNGIVRRYPIRLWRGVHHCRLLSSVTLKSWWNRAQAL